MSYKISQKNLLTLGGGGGGYTWSTKNQWCHNTWPNTSSSQRGVMIQVYSCAVVLGIKVCLLRHSYSRQSFWFVVSGTSETPATVWIYSQSVPWWVRILSGVNNSFPSCILVCSDRCHWRQCGDWLRTSCCTFLRLCQLSGDGPQGGMSLS